MGLLVKNIAISMCFVFLVGCASKMTSDIIPPQERQFEDSRVYNSGYEAVWKAVVQSIGSSFFVLENIQKESGIMSLSFSASAPGDYIDCGSVHEYGNIGPNKLDYTFISTSPRVTRKVVSPNGIPGDVVRTCTLNGKANILVQAIGAKQTRVTVKARYVFSLTNLVALYGAPYPMKVDNSMTFTGKEVGEFPGVERSILCKSKGVLEASILDGISRELR